MQYAKQSPPKLLNSYKNKATLKCHVGITPGWGNVICKPTIHWAHM